MPVRRLLPIVCLLLLALLLGAALLSASEAPPDRGRPRAAPRDRPAGGARAGKLPARRRDARIFSTVDPVKRACALDEKILVRLWRGFHRRRGGDVMLVPQAPNFAGGFVIPGHTGPWDYLQEVPLVLYGPGRIAAAGEVERHANITDIFPTVGRLTGVGLPRRAGRVLEEAVPRVSADPPKLIVTVVWDGVGNNVLARWPDRWPTLARLMRRGTSYTDASVGSSPSITPATHTSLGTGGYPRGHGITAINMRRDDGTMTTAFAGVDPRDIEMTTYADEVDRAFGNRSKVGMLGWTPWHLGMLGHGTATAGGDADELALLGDQEGEIGGNDAWYTTPSFLHGFGGLEEHAAEIDRWDGRADGEWMGHELLYKHADPAWVRYAGDALTAMLRTGGYGKDAVPDLFFVNFKVTDIVGHQYTMDSKEMGVVLEEQDRQLARLVRLLEREVGDYVVVLTSDHGHTPPYTRTGGWPIVIKEVRDDVNRHFDVPDGTSLIETTSPAGLFFDDGVIADMGVSVRAMVEFLNGYTIRDNWPERKLPAGFRKRGDEHLFSAAFLRTQMGDIMRCAFGTKAPPPGFEA